MPCCEADIVADINTE